MLKLKKEFDFCNLFYDRLFLLFFNKNICQFRLFDVLLNIIKNYIFFWYCNNLSTM